MSQNQTAREKKSGTPPPKELKSLSDAVGDFIRYWGFRRIHGQIWTQLYLSSTALSGADLVRRLKVSKALVSPALSELECYGLIFQSGGDNKTKSYKAEPDVFKVIQKILKTREKKILDRASLFSHKLKEATSKSKVHSSQTIDTERLAHLVDMVDSAQAALNLIINLTSQGNIDAWLSLSDEVMSTGDF